MKRKLIPVLSSQACLLAILLTGCGSSADSSGGQAGGNRDLVSSITESGTLRVAVSDAPPNIIKDAKTGQWQGIFPDLARDWAKELGVKVEFHETTFGNMVSALQAGQVDVALDLTNTPERAKAVTFSNAVRKDIGAFTVGKSATNIDSFETLDRPSTTVCVPQGTSYDLSLSKANLSAKVKKLPASQDCYAALAANRVQAVYFGWTTSGEYAKAHDGTRVIFPTDPLVNDSIALAVPQKYTNADITKLNKFIAEWTSSPSGLSASVKKWSANVNPLDYAEGPLPAYVKKAARQTFGAQK